MDLDLYKCGRGATHLVGTSQSPMLKQPFVVVLVSATPAGKRLLERGRAARVRAIAALLADATEAQLHTLRAASDVIADRLTLGRS